MTLEQAISGIGEILTRYRALEHDIDAEPGLYEPDAAQRLREYNKTLGQIMVVFTENEDLILDALATVEQSKRKELLHYFGTCPECAKEPDLPTEEYPYRNIGRFHIFYCEKHRTKWEVGSNLFSGWREDGRDVWNENQLFLEEFTESEPVLLDNRPGVGS